MSAKVDIGVTDGPVVTFGTLAPEQIIAAQANLRRLVTDVNAPREIPDMLGLAS